MKSVVNLIFEHLELRGIRIFSENEKKEWNAIFANQIKKAFSEGYFKTESAADYFDNKYGSELQMKFEGGKK